MLFLPSTFSLRSNGNKVDWWNNMNGVHTMGYLRSQKSENLKSITKGKKMCQLRWWRCKLVKDIVLWLNERWSFTNGSIAQIRSQIIVFIFTAYVLLINKFPFYFWAFYHSFSLFAILSSVLFFTEKTFCNLTQHGQILVCLSIILPNYFAFGTITASWAGARVWWL